MERNKSKLIIGVVLVIAGVGLLFWVLAGKSANAPSEESSGVDQAQITTGADRNSDNQNVNPDEPVSRDQGDQSATIIFTDKGFEPSRLSVKIGATVTIKNSSSKDVQFSSDDHPTHKLNSGMNLRVLAPGESAMFIANQAGDWGFHDHIDDSFTGTITVM